jgi:hypothetical protein
MRTLHRTPRTRLTLALAVAAIGVPAGTAPADSTPVGPLPAGPTSRIHTQRGQLVAVALPHRSGGKVWRVARPFDGTRLRQVSEADVGSSVVLVFRALTPGSARITFGLTRGETAKAFEAREVVVTITRG